MAKYYTLNDQSEQKILFQQPIRAQYYLESCGEEISRFEATSRVVSDDLRQVTSAGVLQHGVHQPVAGLGEVSSVNTVAVSKHNQPDQSERD